MSNLLFGPSAMTKTQVWAAGSKTQFYNTDGTGRDTYISLFNGGFCPPTEPTKIEELGKIKQTASSFFCNLSLTGYRHFLLQQTASKRLPPYDSLKGCELHKQRRWQRHLHL